MYLFFHSVLDDLTVVKMEKDGYGSEDLGYKQSTHANYKF